MLKTSLPAITLALGCTFASLAAAQSRDGHWWNQLKPAERLVYVAGYLDGTEYPIVLMTGAALTAMKDPKTGKFSPVREEVVKATTQPTIQRLNENLDNVTDRQIAEGLDLMFSDYRNQGISVLDCIYVAIFAIKGGKDEQVARLLEVRRKGIGK